MKSQFGRSKGKVHKNLGNPRIGSNFCEIQFGEVNDERLYPSKAANREQSFAVIANRTLVAQLVCSVGLVQQTSSDKFDWDKK